MTTTHQTWTPGIRIRLGLAAFAMGVLLLVYGIKPRVDGRVTYGPRAGPITTLERNANPTLFDQITRWHIGFGTLLTVGGLGLAWAAARSRKQV
jgi:hypothetical protein